MKHPTRVEYIERLTAKAKAGVLDKKELCQLERALAFEKVKQERDREARVRRQVRAQLGIGRTMPKGGFKPYRAALKRALRADGHAE